MPWRTTSAMDEKIHFINEWRSGAWSFRALCAEFGISHTLGYKYVHRYEQGGIEGLEEQSRAAHEVANKTPAHLEEAIVELRKKRPRWGGEKLVAFLAERYPGERWPAISTANLILKRNGLIRERKHIRRIEPTHPIFDPHAPNEIWSADFKGQFRMGNGRLCYPLTIADSYTRYLFAAKALHHPDFQGSKPVFEAVFREFGLPRQIHTDNGGPFASAQGLGRSSQLSVWFLDLDIEPVYSDPAHPEQNGRHERMHRELKAEATRPAAHSLAAQQRKLNTFRTDYNEQRPHKALGNVPPARVHTPSLRPYPTKIEPWDYPSSMAVRYVSRNGAIRWNRTSWVMVSTTMAGRNVGLEEIGNGIWRVFYRSKLLGYLDATTLRIQDSLGRTKRNFV